MVGNDINQQEVDRVRVKTEGLIGRKIRILTLNENEYKNLIEKFSADKMLVLWESNSFQV